MGKATGKDAGRGKGTLVALRGAGVGGSQLEQCAMPKPRRLTPAQHS